MLRVPAGVPARRAGHHAAMEKDHDRNDRKAFTLGVDTVQARIDQDAKKPSRPPASRFVVRYLGSVSVLEPRRHSCCGPGVHAGDFYAKNCNGSAVRYDLRALSIPLYPACNGVAGPRRRDERTWPTSSRRSTRGSQIEGAGYEPGLAVGLAACSRRRSSSRSGSSATGTRARARWTATARSRTRRATTPWINNRPGTAGVTACRTLGARRCRGRGRDPAGQQGPAAVVGGSVT